MFRLLCPNQVAGCLQEIDILSLKDQGFKGIVVDLDNTIIPWAGSVLQPEIAEWLIELKVHGFKLCIVSNNQPRRVREIAKSLEIPFVSNANKPLKRGFRKALTLLELSDREAVVIGDQLFTDVLGGNRLGLFTIWVMPLSTEEFITTKAARWLEKLVRLFLKINYSKDRR